MKLISFFCIFFLLIFGISFAQQNTIKIGEQPFYINSSAALEVQSNYKGFLPPRMTTSERNSIVDPAEGLVIYNITTKQLESNTGSSAAPVWIGSSVPDATATVKGKIQLAGDLSGTAETPSVTNQAVLSKVLTSFTSATSTSTVTATDNILQAFQKIDGNVALKAPIASPAFTGIPTAPTPINGTNNTQLATTEFVIKSSNIFIPIDQYPSFDASGYQLLSGALWVGYDATMGVWKYYKQSNGRGLVDPGNPNGWTLNGTTIGIFNGSFSDLPGGTHINFKYDPRTKAAQYSQDDIVVRIGGLWVDKYETRIINVSGGTFQDNDSEISSIPSESEINGNGQQLPRTWMGFSQKNIGTSGSSWYVAQVALGNNDKRLLSNSEWQLAASGTSRTNATGMTVGGETWASVSDQDISRYGIVGCVGSLWEWVADLGQYGPDSGPAGQETVNQYGQDVTTNVSSIAFTFNSSEVTAAGYWATGRAAVIRGGSWVDANKAGVFAVNATFAPSSWSKEFGFRGVRN